MTIPVALRVDVVLPCLNEEDAIVDVICRLPDGYRAIVVDNGSTDRSAVRAAAAGALVVREPRRGFGSAAHAGLLAASAPLVAFCDADGSMDPAQLPAYAALIESGAADLVLGRRIPTTRGGKNVTKSNACNGSRARARTSPPSAGGSDVLGRKIALAPQHSNR